MSLLHALSNVQAAGYQSEEGLLGEGIDLWHILPREVSPGPIGANFYKTILIFTLFNL